MKQLPIDIHAQNSSLRCAWQNCRFPASPSCIINVCDDHFALLRELVTGHDAGEFTKDDGKFKALPPSPEAPEQIIGSVYYLRVGDRIKVGYASNLLRRMRQYPPGCELLAAHPGTRKDERVAHSLLTAHRLEGREWFADNAEVREHVQAVVDRYGPPPPTPGLRRTAPSGAVSAVGRAGGGVRLH